MAAGLVGCRAMGYRVSSAAEQILLDMGIEFRV